MKVSVKVLLIKGIIGLFSAVFSALYQKAHFPLFYPHFPLFYPHFPLILPQFQQFPSVLIVKIQLFNLKILPFFAQKSPFFLDFWIFPLVIIAILGFRAQNELSFDISLLFAFKAVIPPLRSHLNQFFHLLISEINFLHFH